MEDAAVQWFIGLTAFILSIGGVCGAIMHIIRLRAHNRAQIEKEHTLLNRIDKMEADIGYLKSSHQGMKSDNTKIFEKLNTKLDGIATQLNDLRLESLRSHSELSERLTALEQKGR